MDFFSPLYYIIHVHISDLLVGKYDVRLSELLFRYKLLQLLQHCGVNLNRKLITSQQYSVFTHNPCCTGWKPYGFLALGNIHLYLALLLTSL
ncbi:hypothetical protein D3C77_636450 [compost metagenome]